MVKVFTVSKKGGNNGNDWNGAHPERFFPRMHGAGVKAIWDVRRSPNGMYGSFFDTEIIKWCCAHDNIKFVWRLDFAPEEQTFKKCNSEHWDLLTYAKAYFTPQIIAALNNTALEELDGTAILCAEQELYNCHRLLIAEYFKARFPQQIEIKHLGLAYDRYGREKDSVPNDVMFHTRQYIKQIVGG